MPSNHSSRRNFIRTTAGLLGLGLPAAAGLLGVGLPGAAALAGSLAKPVPPLSFSTLGCPDWSFPDILSFAVKNGYSGIEVRGILHEMDLPKCPEFSSPANIASTLRQMGDKGLKFVDLGSSAELHHPEGDTRKKQLEDARRFIDVAHEVHCPYVRVFPNKLPKEQDQAATVELITSGLRELGEYAKDSGVMVLMETHGDLTDSALLEKIMVDASGPNVGLIWDIYNMWSITKEPPSVVYPRLKRYIHHTHIKDGKTIGGRMENGRMVDGKESYQLLGRGDSPIFDAIGLLYNGGYKGFYSFEWEKLWHPELAAPEVALADYPKAIKKFFKML